MKKRYILTPKTFEIENRLNQDLAQSEELIEVILNENEYISLEKLGFFSFLNNLLDINVDDYEDEVITGDYNIRKVLESIDSFNSDEFCKSLISRIKEVFIEASIRKTGVYFYF